MPISNRLFVFNHLKIKIFPVRSIFHESCFGEDNKMWFIGFIKYIERVVFGFFKTTRKPKLGNHKKTKYCLLCGMVFENNIEQIHHYCKLTGEYIGNAHQNCIHVVNKSKNHKCIQCLFHNYSGYDSHLFFEELIVIQNNFVHV